MSSKAIVPIIMSLLLLVSAGCATPPSIPALTLAHGSDFSFIDVPNKDITITNTEETTWLLIGSVYYGGGHCSNVAADLLVDGSTVESWGQSGCYHNSDTLLAVSLQTIPAGAHTVRFNSAVGDASTYSHSFMGIPVPDGFRDISNNDVIITNAEETTWLLVGSVYYGGGHCSNVVADLLVDGPTVESWGQSGCYHNSDTLSAVSLQTISAGAHTVRFNSAVGDASTYSHSFIGIPVKQYALNVNVIGSGSVSKNPEQTAYTYGTEVQLTATADPGWSFSHWSDDLTGSANPDTVIMTEDKTVTATFTQDQYTLTVNTVGNGSVNKNPDQPTYTYGTAVQLTAIPDPGWSFSGWSGDLTGSTNPDTITMDSDKTVTANFTQDHYTLTVNTVGSGWVLRNPNQATYTYGQNVHLAATADPGWSFSGWSGDLTGSTSPDTITMDSDKTVTATFAQDQYTLTVNTIGSGLVSRNPNQATYTYGQNVQLTATADPGWTFSGWSGDISGSTNPDSIIMYSDKTVTATFAQEQYTLTVNTVGSGWVSRDPDQATYTYGQNVQLNATADPGWSFSYWSGDLTGSTNPDTVIMYSDNTVTATFTILPDTTAPAAVTDLAISAATDDCITLTWTAPGDDGNVSSASQYDVRYSSQNITEASWDPATQCAGEPYPQPAGSSESFVVIGLSPETTYHFALKTADEVPNWSGLSNIASGTTSSKAGGSVSGVVRETDGITPIGGAKIFAYDSNQGIFVSSTESADDGTYIIVGLPAGSYEAKATCSGYVDEWYQEENSSAKADHVQVKAGKDAPDIDFSLSRLYDTPVGSNVTVIDPYSGVTIVFAHVSEAGVISITPSEKNPGGNITGFKFLGKYYDIKTTALYTGPVTVTILYDDADVTGKEENIKLFHLVDTVWDPLPPENQSIDTINNTITGVVDTLSWFAITEPVPEGGCFIATAAYGTPMTDEIQVLRRFRDEYLLTSSLGQALVDLYYRVSPPIAEFITEHPSLKPLMRAGLAPAAAMSAIVVNTTLAQKAAIVGLLVVFSTALAVWARRQRGKNPMYS